MSFGERAALEGILAQLRPAVSIEIGTAEGGTLARIASYSGEVHAIDLTHDDIAVELPAHVVLHTGASADVLPALLHELDASQRRVDLALVDGDHSFDGVAGDLKILLDSPTTARSAILVHDTMNEEVRAGIESVSLGAYEKVVYYELDFVPGYVYKEGAARNSVWGGLGLILCDCARSRAYADRPRQWRYYEPYAAIHEMRAKLVSPAPEPVPGGDGIVAELDRTREALQVVYNSRSWRITAPMRAIAQAIRTSRAQRLQRQ
jgi:hypothetical protein